MDAPAELAILPLRNIVLFPHAIQPIGVARKTSVSLVHEAVRERKAIGVITQRDPEIEDPLETDLYRIGTLTHIEAVLRVADGSLRLVLKGVQRFRVLAVTGHTPFPKASVGLLSQVVSLEQEDEVRSLTHRVRALFSRLVGLSAYIPDDLGNIRGAARLADWVAGRLPFLDNVQRQELLETIDVHTRLDHISKLLIEALNADETMQDVRRIALEKDPAWRSGMIVNLLRNPVTPMTIGMGLLYRLGPQDLRRLLMDEYVHPSGGMTE